MRIKRLAAAAAAAAAVLVGTAVPASAACSPVGCGWAVHSSRSDNAYLTTLGHWPWSTSSASVTYTGAKNAGALPYMVARGARSPQADVDGLWIPAGWWVGVADSRTREFGFIANGGTAGRAIKRTDAQSATYGLCRAGVTGRQCYG